MSDSLQPHRLYNPWNSPGQNTGVGSLSPLQGIFPTQGSNPGLPHCRQIFFKLLENLQIQPVSLEVELLYYFGLVSLAMKNTQVKSELCKCKAMVLFGNAIV